MTDISYGRIRSFRLTLQEVLAFLYGLFAGNSITQLFSPFIRVGRHAPRGVEGFKKKGWFAKPSSPVPFDELRAGESGSGLIKGPLVAGEFFVLLPRGVRPGPAYDLASLEPAGADMRERRTALAQIADLLVVQNGGNGTLHEATEALKAGKKLIVFNLGGGSSLLYHAKEWGVVPSILDNMGVTPLHLAQIHTGSPSRPRPPDDHRLTGPHPGRHAYCRRRILGGNAEQLVWLRNHF